MITKILQMMSSKTRIR